MVSASTLSPSQVAEEMETSCATAQVVCHPGHPDRLAHHGLAEQDYANANESAKPTAKLDGSRVWAGSDCESVEIGWKA